MPKQWRIPCRVILDNATMIVTADTEDEAIAKAKASNWDDIEYATTAEMVDWEPHYEDIRQDN